MSFDGNVLGWWALGVALIALETLLPGAFLLWFGVAALVMGALVWLMPDLPVLAQAVVFAALSFAAVHVYRTYFTRNERESDQPLLNRRGEQLVGRVFPLDQPIIDGYGKIRVGDALWTVTGPALVAGARVRIVSVDGMDLRVEPAGD
jgi:membrane protein implicated in regulation of membrane protease activity